VKDSHAFRLEENFIITFTHRVVLTMNMSVASNTEIKRKVSLRMMRAMLNNPLIA
jgi:hypothetical protein